MSDIEFDTPAARVIESLKPKSEFILNTSLPDLAFLRLLSVQGRLRYFTSTNATLTITPTIGETIFIYKLQLSNNAAGGVTYVLSNDGNERISLLNITGTSSEVYFFDSLVGNGSKAITITQTGNCFITALGWSENTSRIRDVTI